MGSGQLTPKLKEDFTPSRSDPPQLNHRHIKSTHWTIYKIIKNNERLGFC